MSRYRVGETLLVILFAAIVTFQLFRPHSIGLANNGDFAKMIGRFSLGPATLDSSEEYRYFTKRWIYDRSYQWMSADRSSELIPITAAVFVGWWFSDHVFDIRVLGAIHAFLWIGCFAAFIPLLRFLEGWRRYLAGFAAVFIFTDVRYIAYCNSFYTDVAAFVFLAWAVVLWLHFVNGQGQRPSLFILFVAASVLCVSSKSQHAPLAMLLWMLAVMAAFLFKCRSVRAAALALPVLIPLAATVTFLLMPTPEKEANESHVIFMSILHQSPAPIEDARELGLGPEYLRYVDDWSENPWANPEWRGQFAGRASYGRIAQFYLHHPFRTLAIVYRVLRESAPRMRPDLGNYEQKYGRPPRARTKSFGWWSAFRSWLFSVAPWHIFAWYAAVLAAGIRFLILRRTMAAAFTLGLAGMAVLELFVSSLADATETDRHLFLFHVITDFTVMFSIAWMARTTQGRASLRTSS